MAAGSVYKKIHKSKRIPREPKIVIREVFVIFSHSISDHFKCAHFLQIWPKVNKANNAKTQKDQQQLSRRGRQKVYHFIFEAHNDHHDFYCSRDCNNIKKRRKNISETPIGIKSTNRYSDTVKKMATVTEGKALTKKSVQAQEFREQPQSW